MADSSVVILDGAGVSRTSDAQLVGGTEYQQTVTIGDGSNAGRVVQIDSDGSLRVETNLCTTATKTNVTSSVTSVTVLAANANRRGALIFNDSTAILYLSYGSTATSTTSFSVKIAAASLYVMDMPLWTGQITGLWAAANGAARVTDIGA